MMSTDLSSEEPSKTFRADVQERVRVSDIALMLTVPMVLTTIYLLPVSIQRSLVLDYGSPSLLNFWTAAYVHRGFAHFSGNLVAYCLFATPSYLFFVLAGERGLFRYIFLIFLVALPPVLAIVNVVFLGQGTGAGFSGIGAAFIGLVPVGLYVFLRNRVSSEVGPSDGVALFLAALGITAWIYTGALEAAGVFVASGVLVFYDIYRIGVDEMRSILSGLCSMDGYFEFVVVAVVLFLFSPMVLFPQELVQNGHPVNILSHYAGLAAGFFVPAMLSMYQG